jgi:hypothetical protein
MRLGVAGEVIAGGLVPGDVAVDDGVISQVGLPPGGAAATRCPAWSTSRSTGTAGRTSTRPTTTASCAAWPRCAATGLIVQAGHSGASTAQAHAAFDAGARAVTHLFNGMADFKRRDPGLVGVTLTRPDVQVQLIADHGHNAPEVVAVALAVAGVGQEDGRPFSYRRDERAGKPYRGLPQ